MEVKEGNGKSVLVIEDEPCIALVCMRTLTTEGFQVDIAINGEIALEMWRKKDYDLCISDIRTPRMNGIELYRQLESECPESVYKFIFTTGDMLSGNIKRFRKILGGDACLSHLLLKTSEQ